MRRSQLNERYKHNPLYASILGIITMLVAPVAYVVLILVDSWDTDEVKGIYKCAWQATINKYDGE